VAVPALTTSRLVLRGWRPEDLAPFAALNADEAVMEHFPTTLGRAASDLLVDNIHGHWLREGFGLWAVERREDATFLGFTGLSRPSFDASFMPAVEIGWRLAREAWGHGYATEAARAALVFAFERLALPEVVSFTVPANGRSRRVMERIGMTRDRSGDFEHPRLPSGHPLRPHVLYRLRLSEWARSGFATAEGAQASRSRRTSASDAQPRSGSATSSSVSRIAAARSTPERPAVASAQ
jgi:RimJ/RimL family protein N-acetyltransferase